MTAPANARRARTARRLGLPALRGRGLFVTGNLIDSVGNHLDLRAVAHDREHPVPHLYFNLMHYLPVEDACAHGTTVLHAGTITIEAKRRRGARVSPLYALADETSAGHPGPH
ncbi:hypothetical protein G3I32_07140 [Streptomyces coelicoflavus]|uniref:Uncharacterized protein n=1 Tax=Streptomyces coelicoflavus TaxID=285562 RepID=A0A7K3PFB4_9ACTN|nr:hypothetical protein [Streptomyces coelicoflavus]NEB08648.1 hypothetical protein [Streptomyces coelicoflavus]